MSEMPNYIVEILFFVRSLIFWGFMALGLLLGYGFGLFFARLFLSSQKQTNPYQAAMSGLLWGFGTSAFVLMAGLFYFWQNSYVLLALTAMIVLVIPFLASLSLRREVVEVAK
jgi:hypothetical protein